MKHIVAIIITLVLGVFAQAQYVLPGMAPDLNIELELQPNNSVLASVYVPNPDELELLVNIHYSQNLTELANGLGPDAAIGVVSEFEAGYGIEGFTDPLEPGPPYYFRVQIFGFQNLGSLTAFLMQDDSSGVLYHCYSSPQPFFLDISTGIVASVEDAPTVIACPEGVRVQSRGQEVTIYGVSGGLAYRGRPRGDGVIPLQVSGMMFIQIGQNRPIKIFRPG